MTSSVDRMLERERAWRIYCDELDAVNATLAAPFDDEPIINIAALIERRKMLQSILCGLKSESERPQYDLI